MLTTFLVRDQRLRWGGFQVVARPRHGADKWRIGSHGAKLYAADEAEVLVDLLIDNGFSRVECGVWRWSGEPSDLYTTEEALHFIERALTVCERHG